MNKFRKPTEYPAVSQSPIPSAVDQVPVESPKQMVWECVGCPERAAVLHKGTGYCRACYERRNYEGKLVV